MSTILEINDSLINRINQICTVNVKLTNEFGQKRDHYKTVLCMRQLWTSIKLSFVHASKKYVWMQWDDCIAFRRAHFVASVQQQQHKKVLASVRVVHKSNMEKDEEIIMLHLCGA